MSCLNKGLYFWMGLMDMGKNLLHRYQRDVPGCTHKQMLCLNTKSQYEQGSHSQNLQPISLGSIHLETAVNRYLRIQ
ncbi:hypothetical protein BST81_00615 [Leptolyngbya sp. 'hensonii']|nr:hypothetical protein BST81_00615 [Leptolyngbya sp. 'hensonii']